MQSIRRSDLPGPVLALAVVVGFTLMDGANALGAHPLWSERVGFIGTGIGIAKWLVLHVAGVARRRMLLLGAALFLVFVTMIWFGKVRFVASYAQDQLAGRFWFFGWMLLIGATYLLIAALVNHLLRQRDARLARRSNLARALSDRRLEILSSTQIDWAADLDALQAHVKRVV